MSGLDGESRFLGGLWESSLEPAELSRRTLELTTLAAKLTANPRAH